jgi:hypothetical protein
MPNPDIDVANHGSMISFAPRTDAGETWLANNLPDDTQCLGNTRFCEPRFAQDIIDGAEGDGLNVE